MLECTAVLILEDEDVRDDTAEDFFSIGNFRCSLQKVFAQDMVIYNGKAGIKILKNRYGECN